MKKTIEIPLSKNKLIFGIIISLIFVIACLVMMFNVQLYVNFPVKFMRDPMVLRSVLGVCMIFFVVTGVYGFRKMFDEKAGLIIDAIGITDNSNGSSVGLIEWEDITDIEVKRVVSTKFILVNVVNPEKYIERAKSKMKAKLIKSNMKLCGTPIAITSNTLKYDFKNLEQLLQSEFNRNKKFR